MRSSLSDIAELLTMLTLTEYAIGSSSALQSIATCRHEARFRNCIHAGVGNH